MASRSVFLTGATGTVGSGVLEILSSSGEFDVTCLVRNRENVNGITNCGGHALIGDMGDEALFDHLRGQGAYEFIIHAAQAHYSRHARDEIDRLERLAAGNLEKLCGETTKLMVFTSGVWSYGTGSSGQPINESTPRRPFKSARQRTELLHRLASQQTRPWAQLCPPSMVYGSIGPLMRLADALSNGAVVEVLDDVSVKWSVIERLDLGRAYLALLRSGKAGDNYVVAEDEPVAVVDFYESVAAVVGRGAIVRKSHADLTASMDPDTLEQERTSQPVDSSRFKEEKGWRAEERFATSVKRFLAKFQQTPP